MSNPVDNGINFKRVVDLALGGHTQSAIQALDLCNLSEEQKSKISEIITCSNVKDATPTEMNQWIVLALSEKPHLETPKAKMDCSNDEVLQVSEQLSNLEIAALEGQLLPDDKIVQIFSNSHIGKEMSDLTSVCKYWHASIVPSICIQQLNQKKSLSITEFVIYQKRLGAESTDFDCVFEHCGNLLELDFSTGVKELQSEDQILAILKSAKKYCPKLTGLNLKGCSIVKKGILTYITLNFQNLTHLNLSGCGYCTHSVGDIQDVVASLNKLVFLDISFTVIGNQDIIAVANHCPNLQELNIYNSCGYYATGNVTDESIILLTEKCKSLSRLNLSDCNITNASLNALAENCKGLTYFFHYGCFQFDEIGLSALKIQLPGLTISNDLMDVYGLPLDDFNGTDSSNELDSNDAEEFYNGIDEYDDFGYGSDNDYGDYDF